MFGQGMDVGTASSFLGSEHSNKRATSYGRARVIKLPYREEMKPFKISFSLANKIISLSCFIIKEKKQIWSWKTLGAAKKFIHT